MSQLAKKNRRAGQHAAQHRHHQAPPAKPARNPLFRYWPLLAVLVGALVVGLAVQYFRTANVPAQSASSTPPPAIPQVYGSNPNAPVLVEEYGDFQCPACGGFEKNVAPTLRKLADDGKIRFAYYPIAILGNESVDASNAALCAADAGRFWEYHDQLYAHQAAENSGYLSKARLLGFGETAKIDSGEFTLCVQNNRHKDLVLKVTDDSSRKGVNQTPTLFVNGAKLGNPSLETITAAIEKATPK